MEAAIIPLARERGAARSGARRGYGSRVAVAFVPAAQVTPPTSL
jgi:hypothetical protein